MAITSSWWGRVSKRLNGESDPPASVLACQTVSGLYSPAQIRKQITTKHSPGLTLCPVTPSVTSAHCPGVAHSWFSQDTLSPNVLHILTCSHHAQQQDQAKQDPAAQVCLLWPHDTVMRAHEVHRNWTGPGWCIRARYMGYHEQPTVSSRCKFPADSQLHLNSTDTKKLGSSQRFKWSLQIDVPTRLWPVKYISCVTQILPWVFHGSSSDSNVLKALWACSSFAPWPSYQIWADSFQGSLEGPGCSTILSSLTKRPCGPRLRCGHQYLLLCAVCRMTPHLNWNFMPFQVQLITRFTKVSQILSYGENGNWKTNLYSHILPFFFFFSNLLA